MKHIGQPGRGNYLFSLALLLLAAAASVRAADNEFTNESMAGKYAVVQTGQGGRAATAGVGVVTADAQGNIAGYLLVSLPDAQPGARKFTEIPLRLTYLLHADGTGKMTLSSAPIKETTFLITKAAPRLFRHGNQEYFGGKMALEIAVVGKELGELQGNLITVTLTRLPEGEDAFTNAALVGQYALVLTAMGGTPAIAGQALITDDADGNFTGMVKFNVVNPLSGERIFVELPARGTFTVNADGTGTIKFTEGIVKEAVFVITRAERRTVRFGQRVYPGAKVALEAALVAKELGEGGHLLTGVSSRLPH